MRTVMYQCVVFAVIACGNTIANAQCGNASTGDCCNANGSPNCDNSACCSAVCAEDPYCCEVEWDECCAHLATMHCDDLFGCNPFAVDPASCHPDSGDCFTDNRTPGCNNHQCCAAVCACDPFCCEVEWDVLCASIGSDPDCLCGPQQCGAQNTPECWAGQGPTLLPAFSCEGNCGGAAIGGCWCDESCCLIGDCCEDKTPHCFGCAFGDTPSLLVTCAGQCGGIADGGCWCDDDCGYFFDCCWGVCNHCPSLSQCDLNPADLVGESHVNVFDLLELLTRWGDCEDERCFVMESCEGDFNHDGRINVEDLLFLLQNWG